MVDRDGPRVGVLGSYGGRNLGDEAILVALLDGIRQHRPDARLTVFSREPAHTRRTHADVDVVAWEGVSRADSGQVLDGLDLLVLGGGGILYDNEARRYLRLVLAAQERGLPVVTYAVGVGPLTDAVDCSMVREALGASAHVTVRDNESRQALEEAGLTVPITVTADPAFLLKPEPFELDLLYAEGVPRDKRLIGISVREPGRAAEHLDEDGYHRLLAQVGDFLVQRIDAYLVFVPMERDDIRHSHGVLAHMTAADRGRILHGDYRPGQILGLMPHLDMAVGMRLHFLIFAALANIPFLPLPYAGKVFDLAKRLGAPALKGVNREVEGPLLAEVDRIWDEREQRFAPMSHRVAHLRAEAQGTSDALRPLLQALDGRIPAGAGNRAR